MSKTPTAFLRQDIVSARVGLGRHQIRRLEDDGKFPKRVKLGDNSVAWVESEIDEWMQSRIAERDRSNTSSSKAKNAQPLERPGVL